MDHFMRDIVTMQSILDRSETNGPLLLEKIGAVLAKYKLSKPVADVIVEYVGKLQLHFHQEQQTTILALRELRRHFPKK